MVLVLCTPSEDTYILYLPHVSGGLLCFHVGRPSVCPSVRLSVRPSEVRTSVRPHSVSLR